MLVWNGSIWDHCFRGAIKSKISSCFIPMSQTTTTQQTHRVLIQALQQADYKYFILSAIHPAGWVAIILTLKMKNNCSSWNLNNLFEVRQRIIFNSKVSSHCWNSHYSFSLPWVGKYHIQIGRSYEARRYDVFLDAEECFNKLSEKVNFSTLQVSL